MSFSKRKKSINLSSIFFFPQELKETRFNGYYIIISPNTANWLTLTDSELTLFKLLRDGKSIEEVMSFSEKSKQKKSFNNLLTQIISRNFAQTERPPEAILPNILGAHFYLTNSCNLSCPHCYMDSGKKYADELTYSDWIKLTTEFSKCGGKNITFSGGEILLKKGWISILENAKENGISSTILTNGTIWNDQDIDKVSSLIDEVQISIDGPTNEINSSTRGTDSFYRAIETAKKFAQLGVVTSVAMTPTLDMIKKYKKDEFIDFFEKEIKKHGINLKISQKLLPDRSGSSLTKEDESYYFNTAKSFIDISYSNSSIRNFSLGHKPNELMNNCGLGGLTVSSNGDFYPCNRVSDLCSYGNIKNRSVKEILIELNEINKSTSVDNIEPCKYCDLRYICGGGCRLDDYIISNASGKDFKEIKIEDGVKLSNIQCTDLHKESILNKMVSLREYSYGI